MLDYRQWAGVVFAAQWECNFSSTSHPIRFDNGGSLELGGSCELAYV